MAIATLNIVKDARIQTGSWSATNFGTNANSYVGSTATPTRIDTVFQHDTTTLNRGADIASATLYLWVTDNTLTTTRDVTVEPFIADWAETSITWDNAPGTDATKGTTTSIPAGTTGWVAIDITDTARAWQYGSNRGMRVSIPMATGDEYIGFPTRESSTNKPYVEIDYAPAPTVTDDSMIWQGSPGNTYGTLAYIRFGTNTDTKDAVYDFDISSLPAGAYIESAVVGLYIYSAWGAGATVTNYEVFPFSAAWDEGTITWNNAPAVDTSITTTGSVTGDVVKWFEVDITPMVQAWVDGTIAKNGIRIKPVGTADHDPYIRSKEASQAIERPYIKVVVGEPPAVDATVDAVSAEGTSAAEVPSVAISSSVSAVSAESATDAYVPMVETVQNVSVSSVSAVSTSEAYSPALAIGITVEAPAAETSGDAPNPTIVAEQHVEITTPSAESQSAAVAPSVAIGTAISAPSAASTSAAVAPAAITTGAGTSVAAPAAESTSKAHAVGLILDVLLSVPSAESNSDAYGVISAGQRVGAFAAEVYGPVLAVELRTGNLNGDLMSPILTATVAS